MRVVPAETLVFEKHSMKMAVVCISCVSMGMK